MSNRETACAPLIELDNVDKNFYTEAGENKALRSVSLEIRDSEYLSITGPSGSGKTTLLNIIGCMTKPTRGEYRIRGRSVGLLSDNELSLIRLRTIGFVFQNFSLLPRLNVFENVELPLLYTHYSKSRRDERVERVLKSLGISDKRRRFPSELSGGEQQRVGIARAMVNSPAMLLADEPTGNLDSEASAAIVSLFERLNMDGTTVILVTHETSIAQRAHRQIALRDGELVADTDVRRN